MKSYASGDVAKCKYLMVLSAKGAFLMTFLLSAPLLVGTEFLIDLWLTEVPPYSVGLTRLFLLVCIVDSLSAGISDYVFARGNIKVYQLSVNTLFLISIPVSFVVLKLSRSPYGLLVTYLVFSVLNFACRQIVLWKYYDFSPAVLFKKAYLPILYIVIASLPMFLFCNYVLTNPIWGIILSVVYVGISEFFLGLNSGERSFLISKLSFLKK